MRTDAMRSMCHAFVTLATVLLVSCEPAPSPAATTGADSTAVAAVRAALDTSVSAWNRGDLDAHVAIYSDSAMLLPAGGREGRVQAHRTLAPFFAVPAERPRLVLDSLALSALGADHVLVRGQYVLIDGRVTVPRRGWFTEVWARTPAGWRIVHDHSS